MAQAESDTAKRIVRNWFDAVNSGDESAILAMLTPDFRFRSMARYPAWIAHDWDGRKFAAAPKAMAPLLQSPIVMNIVGMIGEGSEIAVEANTDAMLINGKRYDNAYHFVFVVQDDRIAEVREYCCSSLVVETFGAFNPDNPDANRAAVLGTELLAV